MVSVNIGQAVLTRRNSITGVLYKDDPTIMSWELMNEPRCTKDTSGKTIQVSDYLTLTVLSFSSKFSQVVQV